MTEMVALRPKTYRYLTDVRDEVRDENKKAKGAKKCVKKRKFKFEDYKQCFEVTQLGNKINNLKNIKLTWIVFEKIIKKILMMVLMKVLKKVLMMIKEYNQ